MSPLSLSPKVTAVAWLACAALLPLCNPNDFIWIQLLILWGVLVLVPLALDWIVRWGRLPHSISPWIGATSLLYAASLFFPIGSAGATLLSLPWCLLSLLLTVLSLRYINWRHWKDWAIPTTLSLWLVATVWGVLAQADYQPLGFSPIIVWLTVAHFHFAGFLTVALATRLFFGYAGMSYGLVLVGLLLGMATTAAGITCTHLGGGPSLELGGGLLMAVSAAALFTAYWRKSDHWLPRLGAALLLAGMALAALYALRTLWPVPGLDIPWMYRVHGTLNVVGLTALVFSTNQPLKKA